MKINHCLLAATFFVSTFFVQAAAWAQGSLTPPGAPAPTMKTADQIEPRTIVNAVNTPGDANNLFVITNPGSYYLTTNIVGVSGKNGIGILGNNITLDLNGFALQGTAGSLDAINFPFNTTNSNIEIHNGIINGWLGGSGFFARQSLNLLLEHLNVSSNSSGINNGSVSSTVRNCIVSQNSSSGIWCDGGSTHITGCTVENNGGGILLNGSVADCLLRNNGVGIVCQGGSVTGCTVFGSHSYGIYASGPGCLIVGNTCIGNNTDNVNNSGGIVIADFAGQCRIENNQLTGNGASGIRIIDIAFGSGANKNFVIKNTAVGNGVNYIVPGGNVFGPIANDSTGAITNSSPWANFSF